MNDRVSGIYQIRNRINDKIYIGSSVDIRKRWFYHKRDLKNNNHDSRHLQSSWNMYGENNFSFEIIEVIEDITTLISREQYWIDKCMCFSDSIGYNICRKAGSSLGRKHSKETCLKISKAKKGVPYLFHHSQERKNQISEALKGKKHTIESKIKMSESHKGYKHTEEAKAKIRAKRALQVIVISEATKAKISKFFKNRPGKKHSEETKKRLSEITKAFWQKKHTMLYKLPVEGHA